MKKIFLPYSISNLSAGSQVVVTGDDYYHLTHSLRAKCIDSFIIGDDDGTEYSCYVSHVSKSDLTLTVTEPFVRENVARPSLTLVFALLKADKNEEILKRCTEIGVDRFVPVITEYSIPKVDDKSSSKKNQRWQTIVRQASMQCGRQKIPIIDEIVSFKQVFEQNIPKNRYFGQILSKIDGKAALSECQNKDCAIFVGPEGDFSDSEEQMLIEHGWTGIKMPTNVLRSETAAVYFSSVINFLQ